MPQVARPVSSQKAATCGPRRNGGPAFPLKSPFCLQFAGKMGLCASRLRLAPPLAEMEPRGSQLPDEPLFESSGPNVGPARDTAFLALKALQSITNKGS
jgi:hypothetical protein